jgi:starch-binding outer membrane protein, SusD/RagB family
VDGTLSEWALISYFGRFNYNYLSKYLFEANFRRDVTHKLTGFSWLNPTKELIQMYETKENGIVDENPIFDRKDPRMDMTVIRPGATMINLNDVEIKYPEEMPNYAHTQTGIHVRKGTIEGSDATFEGRDDSPNNWVFFRYSDVLLLYAEAVNEVSGPLNAVYESINEVRQRPGVEMPLIQQGKTKDELREIIRRERAVELACEGWRYFDLKRWGLLKEKNDGFKMINIHTGTVILTKIFRDHFYLWPIPLTELDRNPNLIQNQGY